MHDHDGHIDTSGRAASSIWRLGKSRGAQGGVVKFTCLNIMTRPAGGQLHPDWRLCCRSHLCNFPPTLESLTYLLAIRWGRELVAPRSEV